MQSELIESDHTEQAARAQALRRQQAEVERLQARLDLLYDDRLNGRIDPATYDKKAADIRLQQEQIRQKTRTTEDTTLPPVSAAIDLMKLTGRAATLFREQDATEQRKLLHLVLKEASWKRGELRMSLREPFEESRLSNFGSDTNDNDFGANNSNSDDWRRGGDSNSRYP